MVTQVVGQVVGQVAKKAASEVLKRTLFSNLVKNLTSSGKNALSTLVKEGKNLKAANRVPLIEKIVQETDPKSPTVLHDLKKILISEDIYSTRHSADTAFSRARERFENPANKEKWDKHAVQSSQYNIKNVAGKSPADIGGQKWIDNLVKMRDAKYKNFHGWASEVRNRMINSELDATQEPMHLGMAVESIAGKKLPRGTKSDQVNKQVLRWKNEMAEHDPPLLDFWIKAISKYGGKGSEKTAEELAAARFNPYGLTRATASAPLEGIMANVSRIAGTDRMKNVFLPKFDPRTIKKFQKNPVTDTYKKFLQDAHTQNWRHRRTPLGAEFITTPYRNQIHFGMEEKLRVLLKQEQTKQVKNTIAAIVRDMKKLGLQSKIDGKIYGKMYKSKGYRGRGGPFRALYNDVQKEYPLETVRFFGKYLKPKGANQGGLMNYGEMKPVAPLLEPGERQHLQLGGKIAEKIAKEAAKAGLKYVKRQILPKVIGHVEKIVPKLTASKEALKKSTKLENPWAVLDHHGNPIKDFKTQKDAEKWLYNKKETVPEKEYYESTIDYTVGKIPKPKVETVTVMEDAPAMVWKTPTVIQNSPMEIGQGKQWLGLLKKSVSPKELDDTSIGPYLEFHVPNERISKQQLLEAFNEVSPKFDVIPLGKRDTKQMVSKISEKFNNVRGRMEGFSTQDKKALNVFKGAFTKLGQAEQMAGPLKEKDATYNLIGNEINRVMKQLYDIDNAVMNVGALRDPRIPGPIRSIFGDLQELLKIRGAKHAFQSSPKHAGQQVLPGGINYREYVFTSKPGSLRLNEPTYKPSHSFNLSDEMAEGAFVHTRISDRTDNFGRKLLFVEEIQSDMHQKIQAALRKGSGGGYATRQDKIAGIEPVVREMEKVQMKIDQVLAKDPKDATLPGLYGKREELGNKIVEMRAKIGELSQSGTPEGPFQRSEDYGSFVAKYLLRLAKEGNYDGVAVSTGAIKNRLKSEARGNLMDEEATGHYGFYDAIMQNALKKIAKKGNLGYTYTVINDGTVNWGNVPVLLLKEGDKVLEGLSAFREGGLVRENFVDVVPLL